MKYRHTALTYFFIFSIYGFCQNSDTLVNKSNDELFELFYSVNINDTIKGKQIAEYFINRLKKENADTMTILDAFTLFIESDLYNHKKYLDSIERYSEFLENNLYYPVNGYFSTAQEYSLRKKFNSSLSLYFKSRKMAKDVGNYYIENSAYMNLGLINLERINNENKALDIFYDLDKFFIEKYQKGHPFFFAQLNFNFSEAYQKLNKLDSAQKYIDRGVLHLKSNKISDYDGYFDYAQGIIDYKRKNYKSSLINLKKSLKDLKSAADFANISINHYYQGLNYEYLENFDMSGFHYAKVDSIFEFKPMFIKEVRDLFFKLKEKYIKANDLKKQLQYLNKLLVIDSIYNKDFRDITKNINHFNSKEIDIEKAKLNLRISNQKKRFYSTNVMSVIIIISLLFIVAYYIKKYSRQKKLFNDLMDNSNIENKKVKINKINKLSDVQEKPILRKLEKFELEEGFIEKDLLIQDFAKNRLGTNTKYLRSILNKYKNKNFTQYINDLRIDWFVKKIKLEQKYRNYTLTTFANDCGFSTYSTFSRAFEKRTGLKPNYFVNQILKMSNSRN